VVVKGGEGFVVSPKRRRPLALSETLVLLLGRICSILRVTSDSASLPISAAQQASAVFPSLLLVAGYSNN